MLLHTDQSELEIRFTWRKFEADMVKIINIVVLLLADIENKFILLIFVTTSSLILLLSLNTLFVREMCYI